MLRNLNIRNYEVSCIFLNEVLSLNAQESQVSPHHPAARHKLLNEVLSLNAQESSARSRAAGR